MAKSENLRFPRKKSDYNAQIFFDGPSVLLAQEFYKEHEGLHALSNTRTF